MLLNSMPMLRDAGSIMQTLLTVLLFLLSTIIDGGADGDVFVAALSFFFLFTIYFSGVVVGGFFLFIDTHKTTFQYLTY